MKFIINDFMSIFNPPVEGSIKLFKARRYFYAFVVGCLIGIVLSLLQTSKLPWDLTPQEAMFAAFYCVLGSVLSFSYALRLDLHDLFKSLRAELLGSITNSKDDLSKHLSQSWKLFIEPFMDGVFNRVENEYNWHCSAQLSDLVVDRIIRRNWEATIHDLWGDKQKLIINKLSASYLNVLKNKGTGHFDDYFTEYCIDSSSGFLFMITNCDVNHYALFARKFESFPKTSLSATNVLLPSELFSPNNLFETIGHSLTFNLHQNIPRTRIQIFTADTAINGKTRSEDTFRNELEESYVTDSQLIALREILTSYYLSNSVIMIDYSSVINEFKSEFNISKISEGDYYRALFKDVIGLRWDQKTKEELGAYYLGDYVLIDNSIVLRYSRNTRTLELLCGELVDCFSHPFLPYQPDYDSSVPAH